MTRIRPSVYVRLPIGCAQVASLRAAGEEGQQLRANEEQRHRELREAKGRAESLAAEVEATKAQSAEALAAAAARVRQAEEAAEEARREADRAADAAKVKEKMVDSANAWVDELKETAADLNRQLAEEQKRSKVRAPRVVWFFPLDPPDPLTLAVPATGRRVGTG